nr:ATP-dependent DNA helicase RRM3-like isoform X1 [Tanacetum cinerariifolium]
MNTRDDYMLRYSDAKIAIFLAVASLFFWQWQPSSLALETSSASGNSIPGMVSKQERSWRIIRKKEEVASKYEGKKAADYLIPLNRLKVSIREDQAKYVWRGKGTKWSFFGEERIRRIHRSEGHIALATATSGIAASILPGGRTAHSRFNIPLHLAVGSVCRGRKQSSLATLIKDCKLITWDEAPMAKRNAISALNDLLQDLMDLTELFGANVVVLESSHSNGLIDIPAKTMLLDTHPKDDPLKALIDYVYPNSHLESLTTTPTAVNREEIEYVSFDETLDPYEQTQYEDFLSLTPNGLPPHRLVLKRNAPNILLRNLNPTEGLCNGTRFICEEIEYVSFDETLDPNEQTQYEDFLSLAPNGLPPHRLVLKRNAPNILLRNLNPTEGLCNGTRFICKDMKRNVIHADIAFGDFVGRQVFIHRIPLQPPSDEQYTVPFKRVQFPIRLCFAMTINKLKLKVNKALDQNESETLRSDGSWMIAK